MPAARRLRPVPETAPRALGLIRVSKERDGMVSPQIQRVSISDYSTRAGYEIVDWIEGIDESGSRAKSAWWARLEQAVAAVEAGEYDVIVVWKFSRSARNRLKWAVALDRVEAAGGRLESATEQIDVTTSAGRFTRGMFGEMAAFEAERTGEGWKETHENRVGRGLPATGRPKWGYLYDRDAKMHRPDPVTGPVLADLYRRFVDGESMYSLVHWLNQHGHRTLADGLWTPEGLRRVMDAGFASGRFIFRGELRDGIHEPLIDEQLWQAYRDARGERRLLPPWSQRSRYVLSGLVRCAGCGRPMIGGRYGRYVQFRCQTRYQKGPQFCDGRYVHMEPVEEEVRTWLREVADDVDETSTTAVIASARKATARSETERLARELGKVEEALQRLVVQRAESPEVPESVWVGARGELTERHRSLTEALEAAGRTERTVVQDPAAQARGLLEGWDVWPVEQRRTLLRSLISAVLVPTVRGRPIRVVSTWGPS